MKKAYYYLFYKLHRFAISISDDSLNDYKPVIFITILEVLLMIQSFVWYFAITNNKMEFSNPKAVLFPIILLISGFNYYYFLQNNKWKNYTAEFEEYDNKKKYLGSVVVFLVVLAILGGLILSYYCLSQNRLNKI